MIEEHVGVLSAEESQQLVNEIDDRMRNDLPMHFYPGMDDEGLYKIGLLLSKKTSPLAEKYMERSGGTIPSNGIYFNGYALRHGGPGYSDNIHYDPEVICSDDGKIVLRAFSCLLYLNTIDDGQLILPMQKEVISPEAGKLVIFPASYLYPHYVPEISNDRYFVRLHWNLRTDLDTRFTCI